MSKHDKFIPINKLAMEFIWDKVQKTKKEGVEYVRYFRDDLTYLYNSGLVDVDRVTWDEFFEFFEPLRLKVDGAFWLTKENMIEMGKFRFHKIVGKPFNPDKMRKGKYSPERLWRLFENSILPSTSLPRHFVEEQFSNLKKRAIDDGDGMIEVDQEIINHIKYALNNFPSPKRKLEIDVAAISDDKIDEMVEEGKTTEISSFTQNTDLKKTTKKNLDSLLVQSQGAVEDKNRKPTEPVFNLKAYQKPRIDKI